VFSDELMLPLDVSRLGSDVTPSEVDAVFDVTLVSDTGLSTKGDTTDGDLSSIVSLWPFFGAREIISLKDCWTRALNLG
ncbi:hypothetical protein AB4504_23860, partial [Vibrio sp. 10N.222.55.F12]|uniref:hypothetical protein n=1 Tax=Vibrio sp. 10N.222.55.F12 TaxID=3229653 RepID=UPI003551527D